MTRYQLRSGESRLMMTLLLTGVVFFIFMGAISPAFSESAPAEEVPGRIVVGSIFCAFFLFVAFRTLREVHTIRFDDDGTIQLVRTLGHRSKFRAQDIRELDGGYSRDYDGDYTLWGFTLRCSAGVSRLTNSRT